MGNNKIEIDIIIKIAQEELAEKSSTNPAIVPFPKNDLIKRTIMIVCFW